MERTPFIARSIALASAAVTVALGVTFASAGGYLRPAGDPSPATTVLVPVTRAAPAPTQTSDEIVASNEDHERREHHRHSHREKEREHEDD